MNSWLYCTKEFNQELERLKLRQTFIERKNIAMQEDFWNCNTAFTEWFTIQAQNHIGIYTSNWQDFMMDTAQIYPKREDHIFYTRKPNEYHLNMVAAEVMNRTLSEDYKKAKEKVILLPTCMSETDTCQAKVVDGHLSCQNCSSACNVAKLNNSLNKKGFTTVLILHSSSFS